MFSTAEKKLDRNGREIDSEDESGIPPYIMSSIPGSNTFLDQKSTMPKMADFDLMKSTFTVESAGMPTEKSSQAMLQNKPKAQGGKEIQMKKVDAKTARKINKSAAPLKPAQLPQANSESDPIELLSPVLDKLPSIQSQQLSQAPLKNQSAVNPNSKAGASLGKQITKTQSTSITSKPK